MKGVWENTLLSFIFTVWEKYCGQDTPQPISMTVWTAA